MIKYDGVDSVDKSKELKISEEKNDLENWKWKKN